MSYFYGTLSGNAKTDATRTGTKSSGIRCHVRSWNHGIAVSAGHGTGGNLYTVDLTTGSNGHGIDRRLCNVWVDDSGQITVELGPEFDCRREIIGRVLP